jgi:amino acid permease
LKELVRQAALKVISIPCLWILQHPWIFCQSLQSAQGVLVQIRMFA